MKRNELQLTILIIILSIALAVQLFFSLRLAMGNEISHITIQSDLTINRSLILSLLEVSPHENFILTDKEALAKKLETQFDAEFVEIEEVFPEGLIITLVGRQPVGLVLENTGSGVSSFLLDRTGYFYNKEFAWSKDSALPIITFVAMENIEVGRELDITLTPLITDLAEIASQTPFIYSLLSEILIEKRKNSTYLTTLLFSSYQTEILIPNYLEKNKLDEILLTLDFLEKRGPLPRSIDFRSEEIVYRYD